MFTRRCTCVVVSLCGLALCGCDSGNQTSNTPDKQTPEASTPTVSDKPQTAARHPIDDESHEWSLEEALANLEEPDLGLSAAVRLVRLADLHVPMLPDPLPIEAARKLRLTALSDSAYALGVRDDENERIVHTPLLIDIEGQVTEASDDGETCDLYVSRNGDVFPHLLVGPSTVRNAAAADAEQINLKTRDSMRFEVRQQNGVDYLALICLGQPEEIADEVDADGTIDADAPADDAGQGVSEDAPDEQDEDAASGVQPEKNGDATPSPNQSEGSEAATEDPIEVARYEWDPFENMFIGPAADKLPPPFVGRFELDLESSAWLQPVGGDIGEPDPLNPTDEDDEDDWD